MLGLRHLKATILIVGVFAAAIGVYLLLIPKTIEAHSSNESPWTDHYEVLDSGWVVCSPFYFLRKVGDWWVREYCLLAYYEKAHWQVPHGVPDCTACGQTGDHWVSDTSCYAGGYFSCISSGCYAN